MRRAVPAAVIVCAGILSACSDLGRDGTPTEPRNPRSPVIQASDAPGECTTLEALLQQAADLFGPGSPDYNSVRGKLENLDHQIQIRNFEQAKKRALDIVSFTKAKWEEGGLPGTKQQLDAFIFGVMCYGGFDLGEFGEGTSVVIVTASGTNEQEGYTNDQQAGFVAPPGTFNADDGTPVVLAISPFTGFLNTKLDSYDGKFNFYASTGLTGEIVIGVCLTEALPPGVALNQLVLGHNIAEGFEVLPKVEHPPGLACPPTPSGFLDRLPRWLAAFARMALPAPLQAAVVATGGVGGSSGKLSPFGPVDPVLSATGGVGGSSGKLSPPVFSRAPAPDGMKASEDCSFPMGAQVSQECQPQITLTTRQGTPLQAPVKFEVATGGGTLAQATNSACSGTPAGMVTFNSDVATGLARACWTLGNLLGQQKVWVTPLAGGDIPQDDQIEFLVQDQNGNQLTVEPGQVALTYFATAVPEGATTFMCELGTADQDFSTFTTNNANKVNLAPIRVKEPVGKNTIDLSFFMSVTGQSSGLQVYPVELQVFRSTSPTGYAGAAVGSATGTGVTLPGDNGKPALQTIRLTSPVFAVDPPAPGTTNYLWFVLSVVNPPANRTFQYWYTTKLGSTTSPACTDASVGTGPKAKTGPAIQLKN